MGFFSDRMDRLGKQVLEEDEKVLLKVKQSLISDIAPSFILATSKRIIIINNSFWGLYMGHNIATPTDYNSILYKQISSVVLVKGKIFSSLELRVIGGFDSKVSPQKRSEGEIEGLRNGDGERLLKFIEKMTSEVRIEGGAAKEAKAEEEALHPDSRMHLKLYYAFKGVMQNRDVKVEELDLKEAKKMAEENDAKFVWLGSESREFISELLGVKEEMVVKMDPDDIKDMDREILDTLHGYIFVCYNGNLARFVAEYMKKEHNIRAYNLKGGAMGLVSMAKSCAT